MIIAGIGCRRGASPSAVTAAIEAAFARADIAMEQLDIIATAALKADEAGIITAATRLGVKLVIVVQADLELASARTVTRSARVIELAGVTSVAEAAALAAGGPKSRLLGERIAVGAVTCALVDIGPAP
jgi:cobalt-precorrin 5A hydrolase